MATDVDNLVLARTTLISTLVAEELYQLANGAKPQYTLDGESYDWPNYRLKAQEAIDRYTRLINLLSSPFEVQSVNSLNY